MTSSAFRYQQVSICEAAAQVRLILFREFAVLSVTAALGIIQLRCGCDLPTAQDILQQLEADRAIVVDREALTVREAR